MTFGENLARLRKKAGLSQEELAGKLNLTRQTVSKWETGQSEPDLASLNRLCQLLDAGPEELLLGISQEEQKGRHAARISLYELFAYLFLALVFVASFYMYTQMWRYAALEKEAQMCLHIMIACLVIFALIGCVKGFMALRKKRA